MYHLQTMYSFSSKSPRILLLCALILLMLMIINFATPVSCIMLNRGARHVEGDHQLHVKEENEPVEHFVDRMFQNYHKMKRPPVSSYDEDISNATIVTLSVWIDSFTDISVKDMSYTAHLYVRQYWQDPRLKYANYNKKILLNAVRDRLWLPDLFFPKALESGTFTMLSSSFFIWLNKEGDIIYSQMLTMKFHCMMYLRTFPLDEQICSLRISSFSYGHHDVVLKWFNPEDVSGSVVAENITLNEFELVNISINVFTKKHGQNVATFSVATIDFLFSRKLGFYMIYTYLPSILIIIISWLSFFIDFKAAPARISLSLLSVLSLITQSAATLKTLPRISYIKAIDVWIFACLAFVVISLVEFALVSALCREEDEAIKPLARLLASSRKAGMFLKSGGDKSAAAIKTKTKAGGGDSRVKMRRSVTNENEGMHTTLVGEKAERGNSCDNRPAITIAGMESQVEKRRMFVWKVETGYKIDHGFRIIFPVAFAFFNLCYWVYYTLPILKPHIPNLTRGQGLS